MTANQIIDPVKVGKLINQSLYKFTASKHLAWAWNSGENIIMYGPGGYGRL
jgi:hypothetical protein